MKKLLALLLTLVMCLSLAACGGSGTDTSGTDTSSGETGEDSGDSSYRVAMICDSSISDGGWGMSCYNAMVDAAAERGWATEVSDSIAQSAYYDTIISYCDLGYDLIYAPGNQYTDAVLQAAEEFRKALRWAEAANRPLAARYHRTKKKRIRKKYAKRILTWYREEIL